MLTPGYYAPRRTLRYYQEVAVNRTVQAIVQGKQRLLLTMALAQGRRKRRFRSAGGCGTHAGIAMAVLASHESCTSIASTRTHRRGREELLAALPDILGGRRDRAIVLAEHPREAGRPSAGFRSWLQRRNASLQRRGLSLCS